MIEHKDDTVIIYRYADNMVQYQFDVDISGYTAYCQVRDDAGQLVVAFTTAIVNTYYLNLYLLEADLTTVACGNYHADVKLKATASPNREYIQFEINVEIKDADTRIPT